MKKSLLILAILILSSYQFKLHAQTTEIDSLENLLHNNIKKDTARINLLNEVAYKIIGINIDKTLQYANEAKELSETLNFKKGKAESLRLIGIFYIIKADYPKALEYYHRSLIINKEIGYKLGIANALNNIGLIYYTKSDYPRALEYYHKALKINEELGDKNGIQKALSNIGIVYWLQSDYSQAIDYIQKALRINEDLGYKSGISNCLNNIGNIYMVQEDYSQSLGYYQKALILNEELGDVRLISDCLNNLGLAYMSIGNYSEALSNSLKALKMRKEIGNQRDIGLTFTNLSRIYLKKSNYEKAMNYGLSGLEIANELELFELKMDVNEALSKIYAATNNFKKAYEHYVVYKNVSDSVFNEKNIKKTTSLENQYRFDKEKQAIELEQQKKDAIQAEQAQKQKVVRNSFIVGFVLMVLLALVILRSFVQKRKANFILAEQKEEIETQAEELDSKNRKLTQLSQFKEDLTNMIVHDLKNPLTNIINIELFSDSDDMMDIVKQAGFKMLNLVQNILDVYKYETIEFKLNKSKNSLSDLINEAILDIKFSANQKSLSFDFIDLKDVYVNSDAGITKRILVNILTNAVKFSPKNEQITVKISVIDNDMLRISIHNQGPGIPKHKQNLIFERFGQAKQKNMDKIGSTGLGLTFCKMAVEAHSGTIGLVSESETGIEFWFTLPDYQIIETTSKNEGLEVCQEINLTESDKKYLLIFINQIKDFNIFEISSINSVLKSIDKKNPNIKNWVEELTEVLYSGNEVRYNQLINF
ncbi:MAG: tetratricopeptide repeat protein [Bacteroidales bacterium]|nr:tetratricopeptide repeat protein [Bacteroidales bacterium]